MAVFKTQTCGNERKGEPTLHMHLWSAGSGKEIFRGELVRVCARPRVYRAPDGFK